MTQTIYSVTIFEKAEGAIETIGTFTNLQTARKALEKKFHELCDKYGVEELNAYSYQDINDFKLDNEDDNGGLMYVIGQIDTTYLESDYFPVTFVSRDDLEESGYDTSEVDDSTMERLADKMGDAYCENGYWTDLEILADYLEIPKKEE